MWMCQGVGRSGCEHGCVRKVCVCVCVCVWRVGGMSVSGSGYGGYWCVLVLVQDVGVGVWV